jgi:hypothetical protein
VLIAPLIAQLRCYIPEPVDEIWGLLRHLGARREQVIVDMVQQIQQIRFSNSAGTVSRISTQPQGAVTVSFQVAVDLDASAWLYWVLANTSGHSWTFSGCDVYELLA